MAILVVDRYYMSMNLLFVLTFLLFNLAHSFNPKNLNGSTVAAYDSEWSVSKATVYGEPNGYGTNAGACGYKTAVAEPPFSSMVSAGGASLYKSGKGCGACYEVKCELYSPCSKNPVTVVITDSCPGCDPAQFDLSGAAFNAMAIPGQDSQLRTVGVVEILYRKVKCNYIGREMLTFQVDGGSNHHYFSVLVVYQNGDGEIGGVELKQASDSEMWLPMSHLWGAVWKLDAASPLQAPFSLKVTLLDSGESVVASDVIPAGWQAGAKYKSNVNFQV